MLDVRVKIVNYTFFHRGQLTFIVVCFVVFFFFKSFFQSLVKTARKNINRKVPSYCEHWHVDITMENRLNGPNSALVGLAVLSVNMATFYVRAGYLGWLALENCKCGNPVCDSVKFMQETFCKSSLLSSY